jgi:hypothetical protein
MFCVYPEGHGPAEDDAAALYHHFRDDSSAQRGRGEVRVDALRIDRGNRGRDGGSSVDRGEADAVSANLS